MARNFKLFSAYISETTDSKALEKIEQEVNDFVVKQKEVETRWLQSSAGGTTTVTRLTCIVSYETE